MILKEKLDFLDGCYVHVIVVHLLCKKNEDTACQRHSNY